jgi:quinol monooxygenase YgiN
VYVSVKTKSGTEQTFTEASLKNVRNSALEPGVACFDVVLQDQQDDTTLVLVEIFKAHKAGWNHKDSFKYM